MATLQVVLIFHYLTFLSTKSTTFSFKTTRFFYFPNFAGYVVYRVRVRRGNRKRPVTKGQTYGKPKTHGVNELKNTKSKQAVAEVGN